MKSKTLMVGLWQEPEAVKLNVHTKKLHHYVRIGADLTGNQAATELGQEFENHLSAPEQTCTAQAEKDILHIVKGEPHGMGYLVA